VVVAFSDYKPPFEIASTAQRLLDSVPENYLTGLGAVVLTNASALPRKRRNRTIKARQRMARLSAARGLYHPAANRNRAWIEIFVDNTLLGWEKSRWLRIPFIRESKLSEVLFHEIGHHIHFAVRPEYREKEDVADVWKVRLQRNYDRQRFRWIGMACRLFRPLFGSFVARQREKLLLDALKSGQISRAEYQESVAKKRPSRAPAVP
jgi:hypothetical protein